MAKRDECPCCKSLRVMREAAKHPSLTSIGIAARVNEAFKDENIPNTVTLIAACPYHCGTEYLETFWTEFDELNALIKMAANDRALKVFGSQHKLRLAMQQHQ